MKRGKYKIFRRLRLSTGDNSGIILVGVLWILVILTMLSVGLSHRTGLELSLTKYYVGQLRAKYFAWAGLIYAFKQIDADTEDAVTKDFDTLAQCAVALNENSPEDLFKNIELLDGSFQIGPGGSAEHWGFEDEERKINLNGINAGNQEVLIHLILLLGYDQETAQAVTAAIIDWKDPDDNLSMKSLDAEDDYYQSLTVPYHCKNRLLDHIKELFLVRGVDQELFEKIEPYVTVYPREEVLQVNLDTASETVLTALARSGAGAKTNTEISDADSLVQKILEFREQVDPEDPPEEQVLSVEKLELNGKEKAIFLALSRYRTKISRFIKIRVKGRDQLYSGSYEVHSVVRRDNLSVVSWEPQ